MFLVELGCAVLGAPSLRLLEIAVCRDYYSHQKGTTPAQDCKIQEVQMQLGFAITALSTCSILAGQSLAMWGSTIIENAEDISSDSHAGSNGSPCR